MKHVLTTTNRHGKTVRYYRPPGATTKVRLRETPGTPAFKIEYDHAVNGTTPPAANAKPLSTAVNPITAVRSGSLRELCKEYYATCRDYQRLAPASAWYRRHYLDNVCRSINKENGRPRGDLPWIGMTRANVLVIQATIHKSDCTCEKHVSALRNLFDWAIKADKAPDRWQHPCNLIESVAPPNVGRRPWTKTDLEKFVKAYPLGTKQFLALAIMRYTAVRMSDAIRLGPQNVEVIGGVRFLHWWEHKNGHSKVVGKRAPIKKERFLQLHPALDEIIAKTPSADPERFLTTASGGRFTDIYFCDWLRESCNNVGLTECRSHGIRKYVLTTLAQGDRAKGIKPMSPHELMGVSGHTTIAQLKVYTDTVDRTQLGSDAIMTLE